MIAGILPAGVVAVEAFDDEVDAPLFPAEEAMVRNAVDKRRREFATVRRCAREAMAVLGRPAVPVLTGERGAPMWPDGLVGSMTHCAGYRAAVLADATVIRTVGIDAEPDEPLPPGVLDSIALPQERERLDRLRSADPRVHWDRLLFSAKESVYKAWFPMTRRWLDFEEATVTIDPGAGRFDARLLTRAEVDGRPLTGFTGRFLATRGLVVTAIAVSAV